MASIKSYTLKNGKKRYEIYVSNGLNPGTGKQEKIHKMGFKTYDEADKASKILEGKIAAGEYTRSNPQKITIADYMTTWIREYKVAVKEGTRIVHKSNIDTYIIPYIGHYQLDKYTRINHQRFINKMLTLDGKGRSNEGLAISTVRLINATVSNAYKKAVQLGYVKENPAEYVEFPRQKKKSSDLQYYTILEVDRYLDEARNENNPIWYPFFVSVFDIGLRKSEVMALRWQDIDFSKKTVTISKARLYRKEKGELKNAIIIDDTKTPSGERTIPLTQRALSAFLEYRNLLIKTFGSLPLINNEIDFVFVYAKGRSTGDVIRDRTINGAHKRIYTRAGLKKIKVHDGRHTFAVRLRQAGVPLEDIKDLLGHKDVQMTQVYAHISPEIQQRSIERLETYLANEKKKHS